MRMQGVQAVDGAIFEAISSTAADVLVKVRLMALLGLARHAAVISYQDIQVRALVSMQPTPLRSFVPSGRHRRMAGFRSCQH